VGARRGTTAVLAAVGLILLVVGFVIGRATGGGGGSPAPVPTSPSGTGAAGPGPSRSANGGPVGYAHSRQGVGAAAADCGVALAGPLFLDEAKRAAAIRQIGTSGYVRRTLPAAASAARQLRNSPIGQAMRQGAATLYEGAPLAYRLVSYSPEQARVEIWSLALLGNDAGVQPQVSYGTTTTTLRWQDGDWKFDAATTKTGPTPALSRGQSPTPGSAFVPRVQPLREFRYAP